MSEHSSVSESWVPVERRWLGLDKATFAPALVVLGLALVLHYLLPALQTSLVTGDEVRVNDVVQLTGDIQFVPTAGWRLKSGLRQGDTPSTGSYTPEATVTKGATALAITTGSFDGTPDELLSQIKKTTDALNGDDGLHITGAAQAIQVADGTQGVIARYTTSSSDGVIAAFVIDGVGVEVVATGPPETDLQSAQDMAAMIASISKVQEGSGS